MDEQDDHRAATVQRLQILDAFCAVIERREEFMDVVSSAPSAEDARVAVAEMFDLDELQAMATLDLQVRRFATRERDLIVAERDELRQRVESGGG